MKEDWAEQNRAIALMFSPLRNTQMHILLVTVIKYRKSSSKYIHTSPVYNRDILRMISIDHYSTLKSNIYEITNQ